MMQDEKGGIAFLRQTGEPDKNAAGNWCPVVEHHETEGATAQQDVGTPGAMVTGGRGGTNGPEPATPGQGCPVGRGEGARGVDISNPPFVCESGSDHSMHECGRTTPVGPRHFRESPAGNAPTGQDGVEGRDPGGNGFPRRDWRGNDGGKLGAEGGE